MEPTGNEPSVAPGSYSARETLYDSYEAVQRVIRVARCHKEAFSFWNG